MVKAVLDDDLVVEVDGEEVCMSAFTHAYIGDMSLQQGDSGIGNQDASLGCRFCYMLSIDRDGQYNDLVLNSLTQN